MTNEELQEELHSAFTEITNYLLPNTRDKVINDLSYAISYQRFCKGVMPSARIHMLIEILGGTVPPPTGD